MEGRAMAKLLLITLIVFVWEEAQQRLGCVGLQFDFPTFNSTVFGDFIIPLNDTFPKPDRISLTKNSIDGKLNLSVGRMFYNRKVALWWTPNNGTLALASFNTSFSFQITRTTNDTLTGDGLAFLMSADLSEATGAGGSLGILNESHNGLPSNMVVAVEFDTFLNYEFNDTNDNHVGIDVNSLNSTMSRSLRDSGYNLANGQMLKAWVDYDGMSMILSVYIAESNMSKPIFAFLSDRVNLTMYLPSDIYVGLCAATGADMELHEIFSWHFSSTDPAPTPAISPIHAGVPATAPIPVPISVTFPRPPVSLDSTQKRLPGGAIAGIVLAVVFVSVLPFVFRFILGRKKNVEGGTRREFKLGDVEMAECAGPRRFSYKEIITATRHFSRDNYLGRGGFGPVFKGIIPKTGTLVAVKSIGQNSKQGEREFVAEVTIVSRIRHRNLVQLQGWCHEKGELFLVYDLMTNGSLDQQLFQKPRKEETITTPDEDGDHEGKREENPLDWNQRHKIVSGLAAGLLYLHEEWEMQVIHRDVKSANVMLDEDFNARLGDFGMARLADHNMLPRTTMAVGTFGYIAPEVAETGKSTSASDVYSFGTVTLEVACGRTAIDYNAPPSQIRLMEWVWNLYSKGELLQAADPRMGDEFDKEEMERMLCLGLACSHPLPHSRPTMRQVHNCLLHGTPTPPIPTSKPIVVSSHSFFQPHPSISHALSDTSTSTTTATSILSSSSSSSNSMTTLLMPKLSTRY